MRSVVVSAPAPFGLLTLQCDSCDSLQSINESLHRLLPESLLSSCTLRATFRTSCDYLTLSPRVLGGKGGFGSQLRASGNRKSGNKAVTRDAMKDTSGRRLRTLQKAESLAAALRDLPAREKAARVAKREELERVLGREIAVDKFDDEQYFNDCEDVIKDIKAAMQESMKHADNGAAECDEDGEGSSGSSEPLTRDVAPQPRRLQGWDEDEDDDSDVFESEDESINQKISEKGKGKGKEIAQPATGRASKRRKV